MEKKIIGFKLIKEYPSVNRNVNKNAIPGLTIDIDGYTKNACLSIVQGPIDWPEFWEPIYEEEVNLGKIYGNLFPNNGICRDVILSMMKEACRQTLELAAEEVVLMHCISNNGQNHIKNDIRNLINKIK